MLLFHALLFFIVLFQILDSFIKKYNLFAEIIVSVADVKGNLEVTLCLQRGIMYNF